MPQSVLVGLGSKFAGRRRARYQRGAELIYFISRISQYMFSFRMISRAGARGAAALAAVALIMLAGSARAGKIGLVTGEIDTSAAPALAPAAAARNAAGEVMAVVQFSGTIAPEDLKGAEAAGAKLHSYLPENAYVATFPIANLAAVAGAPNVAWVGEIPAGMKIDPLLAAAPAGDVQIRILSVNGAPAGALAARGRAVASTRKTVNGWHTTKATVPSSELAAVAGLWGVLWVELEPVYELHGERAAQTAAGNYLPGASEPTGPGYGAWLASKGLQGGPGITIQVQDDGLDQGIATNAPGTAHPDILGRIAGIFNATTVGTGNGVAGHGQINASIIMGNASLLVSGMPVTDVDGYKLGQGVAPMASVYATKIFRDDGAFDVGANSFADLAKLAQDSGAKFSSNSWGANVGGAYNSDSAEFDALVRDADPVEAGNQPMIYFFSAGNAGSGGNTIGSPGTGKNMITIGAGENSDADGTDGCGTGPSGADNIRDVIGFSSRGPLDDGRMSPTLVSVGTHVQGAASTDPGYNGTGVCDEFWPLGQTNYARSSGTSHSTPTAAGAGIIVYEFFNSQLSLLAHTATPSPALIKAVLVATATDNVGGNNGAGGSLTNVPNNIQGWGAVNLSTLIDMKENLSSLDQTVTLGASGEMHEQTIMTLDPLKPLKITLAWTDQPALPSANPTIVNNLDLEVTNGTDTYLGNVFSGGFSAQGGAADARNNVESVFIQNPTGAFTVRVKGTAINGNGIPGSGDGTDQDFALFIWNGAEAKPAGLLQLSSHQAGCGAPIDVYVSDSNLAGTGSVSVSVTTSAGDAETVGATEIPPSTGIFKGSIASQTGAAVPADGIAQVADGGTLTASYTDADDGAGGSGAVIDVATIDCAAPQILNVQVADAGIGFLRITFDTTEAAEGLVVGGAFCGAETFQGTDGFGTSHSITLSGLAACTTYFMTIKAADAVGNVGTSNAPGNCLIGTTSMISGVVTTNFDPPGSYPEWTHSGSPADNWAIANSANAHSAPDVYRFEPGPNSVNDAFLFAPESGAGEIRFWHTFALEAGFDGGVIEVSTNGGADWQDLGPNITQGGYNRTISVNFSSPIAGRMAWSAGSLGAMTEVVVDMSSFGSSYLVRFRLASDLSVASAGWYIDDVTVSGTSPCTYNQAQSDWEIYD